MIVAEYLFENNPHFTAGDLTVHKHSLVNNTFLSLISLKFNFNYFILIYERDKFID
jgi:dsRNA-specific ribonuclease